MTRNISLLFSGLVIVIAVAIATTGMTQAASTLFGGASMGPDHVILVSDTASATTTDDFSGVRFDDAVGVPFMSLTNLSSSYDVTDDDCGGGAPRFQIQVDTNGDNISDGNVHVAFGPSPSFTNCLPGWQTTGNMIGNNDAGRYDYSAFGGSPFTTYSNMPASVASGTVRNISIVVDAGWSADASNGDGEQTILIDNVAINSTTYSFDPAPVTVTIVKYVDGTHATAVNAEGQSFPMQSCWSATNIGAGCGSYSLAPASYEAQTASMSSGADYSTNEDMSGSSVGADCAAGKPFALVGYSTGESEVQAATSTVSTTSPSFTNITTNKYVIVWNTDCTPELTVTKIVINDNGGTATTSDFTLFIDGATTTSGIATSTTAGTHVVSETQNGNYTGAFGGDCDSNGNVTLAAGESKNCTITNNDNPPVATTSLKVHVLKYLDGVKATAALSSNFMFPMTATWQTANLDGGATTTGSYVLGNNHGGAPDQYGADTSPMDAPANYSTSEVTATSSGMVLPIGAACETGKYRLLGYKASATSFADAAAQPISSSSPSFWSLNSDRYVIVLNETCGSTPPPPPPTPVGCTATSTPAGYTRVDGTSGNDSVTLAPNTYFVGNGGNDKVKGPDGNYIICTGSGNDKITLGNGTAAIDAGNGNNDIKHGNGDTTVTTGSGNDSIKTGNGAISIDAGSGNNKVTTGNGSGSIMTAGGNDTVETGDGDHTVTTGAGNDKIETGQGNDTIDAGSGNNKVKSGGGTDSLTALSGNDKFDGGSGTDTCSADGGNNTVVNCEL